MSFISRLVVGSGETSEVPDWKLAHPTWRFDHVTAGKKSAATCRFRYGLNFFERIGRKGGKISRRTLTYAQAAAMGAKGGSAPRPPRNMDAYYAPRFVDDSEVEE
jgi:hypothetical protein